jgi:hypothetical protein
MRYLRALVTVLSLCWRTMYVLRVLVDFKIHWTAGQQALSIGTAKRPVHGFRICTLFIVQEQVDICAVEF